MEGMEGLIVGIEPSDRGTPVGRFSYKYHADLSSCLTEGYTFSLTEEIIDVNL
jgi:hypothetical protein